MKINETILKQNKEWLEKKIGKINKRAKKLDCTPFKISFSNERIYEDKNEFSIYTKKLVLIDVEVEGEVPIIDGWDLISVFKREMDLVFSNTVPGKEIPESLLPKDIKCQHCGTSHYRVKSYLLQNIDTKEYKEVGSSCVMDFFGHNPEKLIHFANIDFSELFSFAKDPEFEGSKKCTMGYSFGALTVARAIIIEHGWVSKGKAIEKNQLSTVERVNLHYDETEKGRYSYDSEFIVETNDDDVKFVEESIEHFKNQRPNSDYVFNLQNIIELGYIPDNKLALAVSMVGSYYIHWKKNIAKQFEDERPSEWFGELKKRYDFEVTYTGTYDFESDFGLTHIHSFKDKDGNIFKWFTGNGLYIHDEKGYLIAEEGCIIKMKGTVKRHSEYKDKKETVLTRCKVNDIIYEDK